MVVCPLCLLISLEGFSTFSPLLCILDYFKNIFQFTHSLIISVQSAIKPVLSFKFHYLRYSFLEVLFGAFNVICLYTSITLFYTHTFPKLSTLRFLKISIYLSALGLSCGMWDLVPWPGIEPGPPALGAWSLSLWTTREVPTLKLFSGQSQLPYHFTCKYCSNLPILVFIKYCYFLESLNLSFWLWIIISILIT